MTDETPRETAAAELAEAERAVRRAVELKLGHPSTADVARVLAEYDERGRERDAARAEACTWQASAREWESYAKRRESELAGLRAKDAKRRDVGWGADRAELERLRARDEKATAAVREAQRLLGDWQTADELGTVEEWANQIGETLARAHEDES